MFPDRTPNHSGQPVSLPVVPAVDQQATGQAPAHTAAPQAEDVSARVVAQAKQLLAQYSSSPHELSEALAQLRASYLASQYQITPDRTEQ